MRTRTLLVLAVAVGLLILIAGGIQLLRVSDSPSGSDDLAVGETATAGDLEVTVVSARELDDTMRIVVRTSGVDDADGYEDFALIGIGDAIAYDPPVEADGDSCVALTVVEQTCALTFDTTDLDGSTRVLLVRRGEDQRRWSLA